jgi:hypothetical protein
MINNMTDFEKTKQFLDSLCIYYELDDNSISFGNEIYPKHLNDDFDALEDYQKNSNIKGYNRFYTSFQFDYIGNFLSVGAWE